MSWPKYNKPFFFHMRLEDNAHFTGITACAVPTGIGEKDFKVGFSICDVKDNFNKKMGRRISEGRAVKYGINNIVQANDLEELKARVTQEAMGTLQIATKLRIERLERKGIVAFSAF